MKKSGGNKMTMWWPLGILLVSNVMYNVLAKKMPSDVNAFAVLTAVYALAAILTVIIFFVTCKDTSLIAEYRKFNWVVFFIPLCIVGMEVGTLFLYRVGWPISVGMLINNSIVSVCLVLIGAFIFKETVTISQIIGIIAVLGGLFLINK